MKEHPEIDWDRAYPHVLMMVSDFERSLGRNDRAKNYLEEALKGIQTLWQSVYGVICTFSFRHDCF